MDVTSALGQATLLKLVKCWLWTAGRHQRQILNEWNLTSRQEFSIGVSFNGWGSSEIAFRTHNVLYPLKKKNKDCSNSLGSCIFHGMVVQVQANLSAESFGLENLWTHRFQCHEQLQVWPLDCRSTWCSQWCCEVTSLLCTTRGYGWCLLPPLGIWVALMTWGWHQGCWVDAACWCVLILVLKCSDQ